MKNCSDIKCGTYECVYNIATPFKCGCFEKKIKIVSIDKCLIFEIIQLWENGIKTTGCCCGHGKKGFAYIGVEKKYIQKMKKLGYKVKYNSCRSNDEDSFIPKTNLDYKQIISGGVKYGSKSRNKRYSNHI